MSLIQSIVLIGLISKYRNGVHVNMVIVVNLKLQCPEIMYFLIHTAPNMQFFTSLVRLSSLYNVFDYFFICTLTDNEGTSEAEEFMLVTQAVFGQRTDCSSGG